MSGLTPVAQRAAQSQRAGTEPHGIIFADTVLGIALLALAMAVLLTAITREQRAGQKLADARQAVRVAEAALSNMQSHLPTPQLERDVRVDFLEAPGGGKLAGHRWVEVIATVRGQTRSLVGLVPADAPTTVPSEGAGR